VSCSSLTPEVLTGGSGENADAFLPFKINLLEIWYQQNDRDVSQLVTKIIYTTNINMNTRTEEL